MAVRDRGPGLSPEIASRVFDAFFTTKPGGLGLGLAFCRRIAEIHGGKLWAENHPDGGAVFSLLLPANPPQS
jgi:signal transduction histidine kinase